MREKGWEDQRVATSGAALRVIMRRLREIMAQPLEPQARLDHIVKQVAGLMVAEVCSIYLKRQDGSLELFATEGLRPEAVHKTHMKRGEGLVGRIVETGELVNLHEAQSHPSFSYRPETGEELYHSFLGVPIKRSGVTLGVLVVQNKTPKLYSEEEVEALETTAMLLADQLTSDTASSAGAALGLNRQLVRNLPGQTLSEGIALGHIVLHEPRVVVTRLIADDVQAEKARLKEAIGVLRATVDQMLERGDLLRTGEHRDVLDAYRMFAHDKGWKRRLKDAVKSGLTAEAAVERVQNDMRAKFGRAADTPLHELWRDLDDLSDRLLRILAGQSTTSITKELPADTILVARTMGPAELLDYERVRLRGLVIEDCGPASHVAIVAKALGIPAIGNIPGIVEVVEQGDAAIIDAETGALHLRPTQEVIGAYADKVRFRARRQQQYAELRGRPAVTRDGKRIELCINAGLLADLPHLEETSADGIGLFRTELQFLISSTLPRLEQQTRFYKTILDAAGSRPVVFRALDIGGDKVLPYLRRHHEENPALGWRAIRMSLDRPGMLRAQVRALLHAHAGREMRLMLPMVTEAREVDTARALIDREMEILKARGRVPPSSIKLGVMLEVPALLFDLENVLPKAAFISVGSN
ncbi:MAG: GAF domain-containing protein, partial [Hyphomicrobiaceae bacterium]